MKNRVRCAVLLVSLVVGYGCVGKKDSSEAAKDINEATINDDITTNAQGASGGQQTDEAKDLVDLANAGLTELELSKVAIDRAANPRLKTYARAVMVQHSAGEKALHDMAYKKNLTLPTTLSRESQSKLSALTSEKAGLDFDRKYLREMMDMSEKAISKAEGVRRHTESSEVKTYVNRLITVAENQKKEADQLEKGL